MSFGERMRCWSCHRLVGVMADRLVNHAADRQQPLKGRAGPVWRPPFCVGSRSLVTAGDRLDHWPAEAK